MLLTVFGSIHTQIDRHAKCRTLKIEPRTFRQSKTLDLFNQDKSLQIKLCMFVPFGNYSGSKPETTIQNYSYYTYLGQLFQKGFLTREVQSFQFNYSYNTNK